jgi:hypothetical protein
VSDQRLVFDEEPLTRHDQGQRDNMEQAVTFANSSHSLVYQNVRAEHMQQVGIANTCCKARNTLITMEHQVGSYHWDHLMIMGNISTVLSYHIVSIYSWNNLFCSRCK